MIDFLKGWVFNIVTLSILVVLLEILVPTGKTKKIINLISGFVLIIAIINPFLKLYAKGVDLEQFYLSGSNFLDRKEITANSSRIEETQGQQIVEVYRSKLVKQLEEGLKGIEGVGGVKADIIINEDYKSEAFGQIKRVYLQLTPEEKSNSTEPVVKIDRVKVDTKDEQSGAKAPAKQEAVPGVLKREIEEKVNKLLDVKSEDIVIQAGE